MSLTASDLDRTLRALGDELALAHETARVIVVGGAALALRREVARRTGDVDVLAQIVDDVLVVPLSPALATAARRVAASFPGVLDPDWLNAVVARSWQQGWPRGLPPGLDLVEWRSYGPLAVGLAGRETLVPMKVHALMDRGAVPTFDAEGAVARVAVEPSGYDRRHLTDLVALAPSDAELDAAAAWVRTQDGGDIEPLLQSVLTRVRAER